MRRIMLLVLAAMLVVAAAVPVIAQDYYQDYVEPPDLAAQCAPDLQFGNTGNNAPGGLQYASEGDGEFVELDPGLAAACEEAVLGSAAAS